MTDGLGAQSPGNGSTGWLRSLQAQSVRALILFMCALVAADQAYGQRRSPVVRTSAIERLPPVTREPEYVPTPLAAPTRPEAAVPEFSMPGPTPVLSGPELSRPAVQPNLLPVETERALPINLAAALRLSDARPLVVAAAQAQIQIAAAQLEKAAVLWLPNVNGGSAYIMHAGGNQTVNGSLVTNNTNYLYSGGSLEVRVASTDAIFEPLAARQELRARQTALQAAKNEALLATAEAYFDVTQARGSYAAMIDATNKGATLVKHIESLSKGLAPRDEIYRSRTLLAELEQATALAKQRWQVSSATLTRILRLNPETVVVPLEPDFLKVTLISSRANVDELIPIGLTNRPELASHQAVVQATLARLKQERMRPLIPSVLITGNGTPDFYFQGGLFGTGTNSLNQFAGRADVAAQLVWRVENLGFGNQALVRERRGQMQLAMVELFEVQDRVAAEVTQAKAEIDSAAFRVGQAEKGVREGLASFQGNLRGLGQTTRFNDLLILVNRPQEVVASLQQLKQAYLNYFETIADFNRRSSACFTPSAFRPKSWPASGRPKRSSRSTPAARVTCRPSRHPRRADVRDRHTLNCRCLARRFGHGPERSPRSSTADILTGGMSRYFFFHDFEQQGEGRGDRCQRSVHVARPRRLAAAPSERTHDGSRRRRPAWRRGGEMNGAGTPRLRQPARAAQRATARAVKLESPTKW